MVTSIIVLTYNKFEYTKQCIESIRNNTLKGSYELIVIDNGSSDDTTEWLKKQEDIKAIFNENNVGFPKGCNQGIKLSKGSNILLLNNDTVVTENWLDNLVTCLYSSDEIGAVGPVTNSCAYYQAIGKNYKTISEMQNFAKEYNILDSTKWEERLKLIGFCMLIKREVIEKIGLLDEIFTPGNYEDDDYSMRIRGAGYKLILCKDTFIHHYGGTSFKENPQFSKLLKKNEIKFKQKWGFTSDKNMEINRNLVELIDKNVTDEFNVLQIGCGCGATLLYLKNRYKNTEIYGVDINKMALKQADFLSKSLSEDIYNIDKICEYLSHIKYDYILINHILKDKNININEKVLLGLKKLLKNRGKIFVEVKEQDLKKHGKNQKELTPEKAIELLKKTGYENIDGIVIRDEARIREYILYAYYIETEHKENNTVEDTKIQNDEDKNIDIKRKLKFLLRRIENDIEVEESKEEVYFLTKNNKVSLEDIIFCIEKDMIKKDDVYNSIAVKFYTEGYYDYIIPLFQAAYEFNNDNVDAIYNLAYFLYDLGEKESALLYFEKVKGIDKEVDKLISELRREVKQKT